MFGKHSVEDEILTEVYTTTTKKTGLDQFSRQKSNTSSKNLIKCRKAK